MGHSRCLQCIQCTHAIYLTEPLASPEFTYPDKSSLLLCCCCLSVQDKCDEWNGNECTKIHEEAHERRALRAEEDHSKVTSDG